MSWELILFLGVAIGAVMLRRHIYVNHADAVERCKQNIKPKLTRFVQFLSLITVAVWIVAYLSANEEQRNSLFPALKSTFYGDGVQK
jgi:hypothetical protein